ncbi:hypothetical protein MNBD_CHLOROFLEXI01-3930 [hydrothermal vent metagenome]|uniref:Uncharacterized protein n=1 Tax=hydrothermal vent metagenome TaxID=652676 RepID=A0A3B0UQ38_9ZZZZ
MVQRCEHCGQTVMVTDNQCWHCGQSLPKRKAAPVKKPLLATAVPDENTPTLPLNTLLLYAGLTAVALLILIGTTRAISQAPLFQFGGNSTADVGWKPITDSQLRFTLNLPEAWQTVELDVDGSSSATTVQDSPAVQAVSQTLAAIVADGELLLLGAEDTAVFVDGTPVFILVAQSKRLQQLSPQEIILLAEAQFPQSVTIVEKYTSEEKFDGIKGNLLLNIDQDGKTWRCLEQFIPDGSGMYLVATCTSSNQFATQIKDFETILRSFQPLRS